MIYGDVCSGISAPTAAWKPLGWRCAFYSEIDPFPRAVLQHHYPETPLHGDFTTIDAGQYEPIDLLVGGTPCQDFSVAGLRAGMAGDRGNLTLQFLALARRLRPEWVVWENVPGVLSSNGGRDFGAFLGGLGELGYGWAYRTLDAQYTGVPQRRRRVFIVGHLGDWRRAAAVLFERHCLQGHPAPRREAGERVAPTLSVGANGSCGHQYRQRGNEDALIARSLNAHPSRSDGSTYLAHSLRADGFDASEDGTGRGTPLVPHCFDARQSDVIQYGDKTGPLDTDAYTHAIAIQERAVCENPDAGPDGAGIRADDTAYTLEARTVPQAVAFSVKDHGVDAGDIAPTLRAGGHAKSHANGGVMPAVAFAQNQRGEVLTKDIADSLKGGDGKPGQGYPAVALNLRGREGGAMAELDDLASLRAASGGSSRSYVSSMAVRRLTPRECERLQGFKDDFTLVPYRGKPAADGPRYKALGNSMAVPVVAWIGQRIKQVMEIA